MYSNLCKAGIVCSSSLVLFFFAALPVAAQHEGTNGPPKVLVIQREVLKPGKGGSLHEKSESAFVRAMSDAKWPTHYIAMDSLSGPSRSLFLMGYPSFAAWEQDNWATRRNKTLSGAVDRAAIADGDLLSSYESSALELREDLSLNSRSLKEARYFEIIQFNLRPGHEKEWEELVHMYMDGVAKAGSDRHWDTFETVYGVPPYGAAGGSYLVVILMNSLAEQDAAMAKSKKFDDAVGASGMEKIAKLTAACVASQTANVFEINPRMSYADPQWVSNEPDFWKVAPVPAAKKPAPKPAP